MIDEARAAGSVIDTDAMSRSLGVPVVAVSARTGEGLDALRDALRTLLERGRTEGYRAPATPASATLELPAQV
jgi:ferrous iron transport protein B